MGTKPRLPFLGKDRWRWRWMQQDQLTILHRIKSFKGGGSHTACDGLNIGIGVTGAKTVCGIQGDFAMPGLPSRMDATRCLACCRKLGIPNGYGAPYNEGLNA